ncbi:glutathione S-transferase omega-1-like isoform X2 [Anneissia japonica]|uniref:glutathione S-transferase omega-1-like isoform X1 n=2 Tax=Anneissia japonica TaxID=1529436 RepID=UPI001425B3CA|nr:glutathione S-transferase omega-1-like isoform X1 [Anneissia japonica]XP_033122027.1 glutathione S-transferase omega-1-like isoform X2 [Anneissia japonica]
MPSYPKHHASGEALPPLESGKLRIYSMQFCPFAQRARLVAEAKGLDYEVINCNLKNKPEWLLEKNPNGQVPALEHDGKVLYESLIVSDYLNDAYPGRKLKSSDPYKRARDDLIVNQFGSKIIPAYYKAIRATAEDKDAAVQELIEKLSKLEKIITNRATPFFGGQKPTMVDFMIWPWLERLRVSPMYDLLAVALPKLYKYEQDMHKIPAVKATVESPAMHRFFLYNLLRRKPIYDYTEEDASKLQLPSKL